MPTSTAGGFVRSPSSSPSSTSFIPSTTASTTTTLASPPPHHSTRPISAREESQLISLLDDQITTISSRFTRRSPNPSRCYSRPCTTLYSVLLRMTIDGRNNEGGYTSLRRLSKGYHHLLRTLLSHSPPPKPFTITQYLIRIIGDLNEQLPSLPVPDDPRGIFYILKQLDDAVVRNLRVGDVSQTERVRLRNELERGRGVVAETFEGYEGIYEVEEVIGRVYERSLEEMEEPFGVEGPGLSLMDEFDDEDRLQENVMDDVDLH